MQETVLITGGSGGIGAALARCFAAEGSKLILVARSEEGLRDVADELRSDFAARVSTFSIDLANPDAPDQIYRQFSTDTDPVDVLVNNAGIGGSGDFAKSDPRRQSDILQVNITALTKLTRLFLPDMIKRNRGGVLNVASTAAFQAGPGMAVYYASKAYVLSFTEAIAEEVRSTKLHVSCFCPGPTKTRFAERANAEKSRLFSSLSADVEGVARDGYRAFRKGKTIAVTGFMNKVGVVSTRLVPRSISRKIAMRLNSSSE